MSKRRMIEKTIKVTIIITDYDGKKETMLEFYEPESGDRVSFFPEKDDADYENTIYNVGGSEICSWITLMDEELDEMEYDED